MFNQKFLIYHPPLGMSIMVEMTNAGLEYHGSWDEVCVFSRKLKTIMDDCISSDGAIDEYSEWRPKEHEDEEDVKKKTAKKASLDKRDIERKSSNQLGTLIGVSFVRLVRKMERVIYHRVMLNFNPYYFDTVHFSTNLEAKGNHYVLTINIPDEDKRERVKENVKSLAM